MPLVVKSRNTRHATRMGHSKWENDLLEDSEEDGRITLRWEVYSEDKTLVKLTHAPI
jgi:hypothetical protein